MNRPAKFILGAVATGCIAVGVAAQTGTIRLPTPANHPDGSGGVEAQQQVTASPSTSPEPVQATPPAVESAPPAKKKKHGG